MKKLFISLLVISFFTIQSCSRDYECHCTYYIYTLSETQNFPIQHNTHADAVRICDGEQQTLNGTPGIGNASCNIQ